MSICPRCGKRHNDHGGDPFAGAYCLQCKNSMRYDGRRGGGGSAIDSLIRKIGFPLLIIGFVGAFIMRYMAYVVSIGIIAVVCFLTCKYLRRKGNSELKVFVTVLISLGLVGCVFLIVPRTQYSGKQAAPVTRNQPSQAQARFMLVGSDALNVRGGPSTNHDVVGQLSKNTRVQVLDSSGQWFRIRSGNIEGYVNSTYLINEGTTPRETVQERMNSGQVSGK